MILLRRIRSSGLLIRAWRLMLLTPAVFIRGSTASTNGPINVFVLAGQSNMVGPGSVTHLHQLVQNRTTRGEYQHLWNGTNWKQRDDVFIAFDDQSGNLTVGYGAPHLQCFGPELEFGWVVGDALRRANGEQILIIKTAWGGKSLAIDFRPPSSGTGNYTTCDEESGCHPHRPLDYGFYYREMVRSIQATLANISAYVPGYNPSQGYEIAGFVWFQGWNDVVDWNKINEYEVNLQNLIRDVRLDLEFDAMPFIIGELGQAGVHPAGRGSDKYVAFRRIQQQVANQTEFRNNTRFVWTSPYVIDNEERFAGDYHYYGRADTFCHIGRAFGQVMLELITFSRNIDLKNLDEVGIDQASY